MPERGPWQLTGVPYTSMRLPGGIADASSILRGCGLAQALAGLGVDDAGDLSLVAPDGRRGPSGLLNEPALVRLVEATGERVLEAGRLGRRPLLVGGDCPVILGALAAAAAASPGCAGASVVIYNPDLDPQRTEARKVIDFLSRLTRASSPDTRGR